MSKRKRVAFWALLIFVSVLFAAAIKPYLHDRSNNAETSRADVSSDESAEDADSGENPSDEVPLSEQERQIEEAHITVGLKGSEEMIVKQGDPFINPGAFAIDDRTGPLSIAAERGHVDTGTPGEYHISYTFSVNKVSKTITRRVIVLPEDQFAADTDGVSVLMYHYVAPSYETETLENKWCISTDSLDAHMKYLSENGCYFPSIAELRAYIDGEISIPARSVIVTFDDGGINMFENGLPILEKYKVPAMQFMIGTVGAEERMKKYASPYLLFESHSYDMHKPENIEKGGHRAIQDMDYSQIVQDIRKNREIVLNNDAFAYPYGVYTDAACEALTDEGIKCAFTIKPGYVFPGDDPMTLHRQTIYGYTTFEEFLAML